MKIKKVLLSISFALTFCFMFVVFNSLSIKAYSNEYCIINGTNYKIPFTLATASYTTQNLNNEALPISEIHERISDSKVTTHNINMDMDCNNFNVSYNKSYDYVNDTYSISNMLLDTYEDNYWSYSQKNIYYNNSSYSFSGSYYMESYYILEFNNQTNYRIIVNGEEYQNNSPKTLMYDSYPTLMVEFHDEYGNNVSNEVTMENINYEYVKVHNYFEINPYSNNEDIVVICKEKEIIPAEFDIISFYNEPKTIEDIINTLNVTDNIDGNVNYSIVLTKDEYSSYESTVGTYIVELYATDNSNNKSYCKLTIHVIDTIAPIINGPSVVYNYLSDIKDINTILYQKFSIYDEHDGNLLGQETITYDEYDQNAPGDYVITLTVSDSSSNTTSYSFTISIIDDIPPVITINDSYYIYTSANEYIGIDKMVYVFIRDNLITTSFSSYEVCEDTYTESFDKEGTYKVLLMFNYGDEIEYKEINVVVEKDKINNKSKTNYLSYLWLLIPFMLVLFIVFKFNKAFIN